MIWLNICLAVIFVNACVETYKSFGKLKDKKEIKTS